MEASGYACAPLTWSLPTSPATAVIVPSVVVPSPQSMRAFRLSGRPTGFWSAIRATTTPPAAALAGNVVPVTEIGTSVTLIGAVS